MRVMRVSIVLAAMLLVGPLGCSTSGGDDAAPTTSRRAEAATTTTEAGDTEPETTMVATTVVDTTTTSAVGGDTVACDLVAPEDLTAAGIEGTITEDGDVSDNFSLGTAPSTACAYFVQQGTRSIGLTVLISDGVAADAIDDATDFEDDPQEVSGVGDRAIYSEGDGMMDATENAIYAQQGTRLIKISSVDATFTPQATLEALARTLLSA